MGINKKIPSNKKGPFLFLFRDPVPRTNKKGDMVFRFIVVLLLATGTYSQNLCQWNNLCNIYECPIGMKCSEVKQSCVCENDVSYVNYGRINLTATVLDFRKNISDFENGDPDPVSVESVLSSEGLPVFSNETRFDYLFKPKEGLNLMTDVTLFLTKAGGIYKLDYLDYFPIDNMLYGNEGYPHNYHFSTRTSWMIDYNGGEYVYLRYDDGILLYLNGYLIVNEPGLHYNGSTYLLLDDVAGDAGVVPGNSYVLNVFHMERHTIMSMFYIETDLLIHPPTCRKLCESDSDCNHGLCHGFQKVCHCNEGWAGDYCDQGLCWNIECGDHGKCDPYNGTCTCKENWTGSKCQFRTCNYHGHGNRDQECICDKYYKGTNCDQCEEGDDEGNKYLCDSDGKLKLVSGEWYEDFMKRHNCFRPGTNGHDCTCKKNPRNYVIIYNDESYYNQRIDNLVQNSKVEAEILEVSSGNHKEITIGILSFGIIYLIS